jgi:hypothetical protein
LRYTKFIEDEEAQDALVNTVAEWVAEEDNDGYVQVEVVYVDEVSQSEVCESYRSASNSAKMSGVYESGVEMFKVCELSDTVFNVYKPSVERGDDQKPSVIISDVHEPRGEVSYVHESCVKLSKNVQGNNTKEPNFDEASVKVVRIYLLQVKQWKWRQKIIN